ncbi:hypothetical protein D3C78_1477600 [compost metagenome]
MELEKLGSLECKKLLDQIRCALRCMHRTIAPNLHAFDYKVECAIKFKLGRLTKCLKKLDPFVIRASSPEFL